MRAGRQRCSRELRPASVERRRAENRRAVAKSDRAGWRAGDSVRYRGGERHRLSKDGGIRRRSYCGRGSERRKIQQNGNGADRKIWLPVTVEIADREARTASTQPDLGSKCSHHHYRAAKSCRHPRPNPACRRGTDAGIPKAGLNPSFRTVLAVLEDSHQTEFLQIN